MAEKEGRLYVVSTPIGNLEDITFRAIKVLRKVKLIAAEDTRRAKKLLARYRIKTPLTSLFEHNEPSKKLALVKRIVEGDEIALISNAGTPAISDPGYHIINLCIEAGIDVDAIPGPSAFLAAAIVSGFPLHRFIFEGFLPAKKSRRIKKLSMVRDEASTLIFYESPHRILKFLTDVQEILGNRALVIARELTKMHQEIYRGSVSGAIQKFTEIKPRGEFTIVIRGSKDENS